MPFAFGGTNNYLRTSFRSVKDKVYMVCIYTIGNMSRGSQSRGSQRSWLQIATNLIQCPSLDPLFASRSCLISSSSASAGGPARAAQRRRFLLRCAPLTHSKTCYTSSVILSLGVSPMRRRDFIALLGSTVAAWPRAARAQRSSIPVIGFLDASTAADTVYRVSAFRDGLKEAGFIDGHNVAIEFRWAENKHDQLPALAADLAQRQVAVIVGPNTSMRVARAATSTIPIVFISGGDPIETGLVTNLSRPGGNITGVTYGSGALQPKRLGLLHELVPRPATIAWLGDPRAPTFETEEKEVPRAARELGRQLLVLNAQSVREIDAAFATIVQSRAGALLIGGSILFNNRRRQLAALAARHGVPAIKSTYSAP